MSVANIAALPDDFVTPACTRGWIRNVTTGEPKKRSPGQSNAEYDNPEVDPNVRLIEAESSGGLGWGTTEVGGYKPLLVRILRALARRREERTGA